MIAVLLFLNSRGDTILSRSFRDGYSIRLLADSFRDELITTGKVDRSPINILGKMCYVHLKLTDLYMVMISAANMNCVMCIQYGVRLLQVIQGYYGRIDETVLKENFVALQEIIDDTMDFGYPQLTDTASLKEIVGEGGLEVEALRSTADAERIATKIMGAIPWREEGLIYRVNELLTGRFMFNTSFQSSRHRIRISTGPAKAHKEPADRTEGQSVDFIRSQNIDAVILQVLKRRKALDHEVLCREVITSLQRVFTPTLPELKGRIEALIERTYISRGSRSGLYVYSE